ncbi:MAG: protein BatD [Endomicrobiales bacterium]|nr:protein BatD [Endomicrobiales bacterium]
MPNIIKSSIIFITLGITLTLAPCCLTLSFAADISISASVDKNVVSLDDQLLLEVNVSGSISNIPNPNIPELPNFTAYSSGRSQNISIVNGQMTSSVAFRYALVPKSTGKFTIPPITLNYEGKTYSTSGIPVEVTGQGKAPAQSPAPQTGTDYAAQAAAGKLFVTATLDKAKAYVNEQITYTFRFYRNIRLLSNPQYQPPNFQGFWTEDSTPKNYYTTVQGRQYLVTEIKTFLFATKPGKYELGNAILKCSIEDFSSNDPFSDEFFRNFFSGGKTQLLQTKPISLTIVPLPEKGRPDNFGGAVGHFNVSAGLDKKAVKANEPVTVSVTVSGKGNIKTVPEPDIGALPGFKKYETASSLTTDKNDSGVSGSKVFKTIIVPLSPGKVNIKPISFSFFDPGSARYRTVAAKPLVLDVSPAAPGSVAPDIRQMQSKSDIKVVNKDIAFIKTPEKPAVYSGYLHEKPWFIAFNVFLCVLYLGFFAFAKWQEKLKGDVAFARRIRASATARRHLKKAKALMNGDPKDYYSAISRAVLEFSADKMNVSAEGLTVPVLNELLSSRGTGAETMTNICEILSECDMVRFAPTSVTEEMKKSIYEKASITLTRLDRELK